MQRLFVICATVLCLMATSCRSDAVSTGERVFPTAVPAPTVAGELTELDEPEVQAEVVLVGVASTETVQIHALPGLDQPLAAEVPPGTGIELLGQAFETEDGLTWWQVRAGTVQGWIQPQVAYRGAAEDITDRAVASLAPGTPFSSPEEAAAAVTKIIALEQGAGDIIVVSKTEVANPPSATITTDLLGLEDDSVLGLRIIVASAAATSWQPASVIQAPLCARGVTPEGLCL